MSLLILLRLSLCFQVFPYETAAALIDELVGLQSYGGSESFSQAIWLWTLRGFKRQYILKPKNRRIHSLSAHKNITYNSNNKVGLYCPWGEHWTKGLFWLQQMMIFSLSNTMKQAIME